MHRTFCGLLAGLVVSTAHGAVIVVGEGEAITRIADAARIAVDGDTVLIKPGVYRGDAAVWTQRELDIVGLGPRPVLLAAGRAAEGKAIWVFRGGRYRVRNIEFRGARVTDGNGAGIRFEGGELEVRDCVFDDNQMGLLTANTADATLAIHDSVFANAPQQTHTLPHLLYIGTIARARIEGSRFEHGHVGHLIKSRARENIIRYNRIVDGAAGKASYEIDLPNGGDALLVGNIVGQSAATENPALIAFGAEGPIWPDSRLRMAHNTLINAAPQPAGFLRVWSERLPAATSILTRNNLLLGPGSLDMPDGADHAGNTALPAEHVDANTSDYAPTAGSPLRRQTVLPAPPELQPDAEFALPQGVVPLPTPARWVPGARQGTRLPVAAPPDSPRPH